MAEPPIPREHGAPSAATLVAVWSRRRWLALFCLAVPLSATLSAAAFLPNRYRSTALVVVERAPLAGAPVAGEVPASTEAQIQRLHEENLSRSHLQGLVEQLDLYPELAGKASLEATTDVMRRDIRIESKDAEHAGGRSLVAFQISFRGRDPERVAKATNALASFYVDRSRAHRAQQAKNAIAMLEAEIAQMKQQLDDQGRQVNDFISTHLHELPDQVPLNLATLERLNAMLVRNRDARARPRPELGQDAKAETLDASEAQLEQLTGRLGALRRIYTDQHPDVVALKAEIAALTEILESRRAAPLRVPPMGRTAALPAPAPGAPEGERRVLEHIAATESRVYNAPKRERELEMLLAPYHATRQIYGSLRARLEDARLAFAVEQQQALDPVRVLDPAMAARAPIAPDRMRILASGLIGSLLFAATLVLLRERLDTSFHSVDDLRAFTRVRVLASVPDIVSPRDRARRRRRARWAGLLLAVAAGAAGAGTYALVHDNEALVRMLARGA